MDLTVENSMNPVPLQCVLGSRSPRRLELLQKIVPAESILVLPPRSTEESGFEDLHEVCDFRSTPFGFQDLIPTAFAIPSQHPESST